MGGGGSGGDGETAGSAQLLLRRAGHVFHTTAEREVVRCIKEETCYVAFNPAKEEKLEAEHHRGAR